MRRCVGGTRNKERNRSSHLQMFFKIGVLNFFVVFAIFTRKHSCRSFFLMKLLACLRVSSMKMRHQHMYFPVNIAKSLRTAFLQNTSGDCFCRKKNQGRVRMKAQIKTKQMKAVLRVKIKDKAMQKKILKQVRRIVFSNGLKKPAVGFLQQTML